MYNEKNLDKFIHAPDDSWTSFSMLEKIPGQVLACWERFLNKQNHARKDSWTSLSMLEKIPGQV